mmetsp:Transcript_77015/g.214157  ORF Transcript_77015/g.214157 Transcript_77015/m.214157 type:complete len:223 (+) Transcript_77015:509-1177(+)
MARRHRDGHGPISGAIPGGRLLRDAQGASRRRQGRHRSQRRVPRCNEGCDLDEELTSGAVPCFHPRQGRPSTVRLPTGIPQQIFCRYAEGEGRHAPAAIWGWQAEVPFQGHWDPSLQELYKLGRRFFLPHPVGLLGHGLLFGLDLRRALEGYRRGRFGGQHRDLLYIGPWRLCRRLSFDREMARRRRRRAHAGAALRACPWRLPGLCRPGARLAHRCAAHDL